MYKEAICRVCLAGQVKMYSIADSEIQELYERLTNEKLSMNNLPETLCYICYALFNKCYKYCKMALESNRILLHYSEDKLPTNMINRSVPYSMSEIKHMSVDDTQAISKVEVKTEPFYSDDDKMDSLILDECLQTDSPDNIKVNNLEQDNNNKNEVFVTIWDSKLEVESSDDEVLVPRVKTGGLSSKKSKLNQPKRPKTLHLDYDRKAENAKAKRKKDKKSNKKESVNNNLKKRISCNVCNSTFATRSSFTTHYRIHTGEKPFSCHLCSYKCRRKYNLDIHSRVHNGQKPYNCHLCDYKCSIKKNLNRHLLVHTGEKPFSCDLCDKKFTQNSSLTCHKMRLHSNERPFSCDACDHNFVRKQDLEVHKMVHLSGRTPRERKRQTIKSKERENTFLCHICDYKCSTKTVLNVHINAHNGIKPFACDMCDFKCTWKGTLKAHMRRHTGEKPFLCHMCDFKCAQKCNLITHIRTHTGEKAYSCDMCDYKSTQGSHMKQHKKIHTGEKAFKCSLCNYKCSYKQRLDKHVMSVHKKEIKPDLT